MQTEAEKLNENSRRDNMLSGAAILHALIVGGLLVLGGVNPYIAGSATAFTFIAVKLLLSIRDRLPDPR